MDDMGFNKVYDKLVKECQHSLDFPPCRECVVNVANEVNIRLQRAIESWKKEELIWVEVDKERHRLRAALEKIRKRSERICNRTITTAVYGHANYCIEVCEEALGKAANSAGVKPESQRPEDSAGGGKENV